MGVVQRNMEIMKKKISPRRTTTLLDINSRNIALGVSVVVTRYFGYRLRPSAIVDYSRKIAVD